MKEDFTRASAKAGVNIVDAGHFGAGQGLEPLVLGRADEARLGEVS